MSAGLDLLRKEACPGVHNPRSCWDTAGVDAPRCPEAGISRPGWPGRQRQGRKLLANAAGSRRLPTAAQGPSMPVPHRTGAQNMVGAGVCCGMDKWGCLSVRGGGRWRKRRQATLGVSSLQKANPACKVRGKSPQRLPSSPTGTATVQV